MCGIAGILGIIDQRNRSALARMTSAMAHRGPDAERTWCAEPDANGWGAMLGHRRLSILDLSSAADQPMVEASTGAVIVFNGELFNYQALREDLAGAGEMFTSTGDTAVMLRMLAVQGDGAIPRFRGMFAFAFWDPRRRELLLARDPLGIKPLYLALNRDPHGDWSIAFASEVRALLASGLLPTPRLDPTAAASVVWNGFVIGPGTAVEGIELLWPGSLRAFASRDERRRHEYWSFPRPRDPAPPLVETSLRESVRLHLASDVPIGVFLSGGVDSSAVANLAQQAAGTPIHSFTLAFEEQEFDESAIARAIAAAIGTRHTEIVLTEREFVDHLDAALDSLDQPTFDGLNSFYMARAVRQAGLKVALVGTGGDELFGGYTSFRDLPPMRTVLARLAWTPRTVRRALATVAAIAIQRPRHGGPGQTRWAKLPDMIRRGDDLVGLYQLAYALFLPDLQRELLRGRPSLRDGLPEAMRARLEEELRGRTPLASVSMLEQRLFLGERLLRDSDAATMAASLELRLPLVDQVLLETVTSMPEHDRYRPIRRKSALRRLGLQGLDPKLFDRPKSGFVLPYDRWIRQRLGKTVGDVLQDPAAVSRTGLDPAVVTRLWKAFLAGAPGLYWSRIWALYVLVRWCHRHRVFA